MSAGSTRTEEEEEEQCAVCRMEFEPDEEVVMLPCKHLYHGECIAQWLKDRKVRAHLSLDSPPPHLACASSLAPGKTHPLHACSCLPMCIAVRALSVW